MIFFRGFCKALFIRPTTRYTILSFDQSDWLDTFENFFVFV